MKCGGSPSHPMAAEKGSQQDPGPGTRTVYCGCVLQECPGFLGFLQLWCFLRSENDVGV